MPTSPTPPLFSRCRAVLFDLDGTLVDSRGDIRSALNALLGEERLDPLSLEDVTRMIGDGAAVLVNRVFGEREHPVPAGALPRFLAHYERCCLDATRPYAGIPELLDALRHASPPRVLAVVTNKPTALSEKVVAGTGLGEWFAAIVGPERAPAKKPSPAHVLATLERLRADAAHAVVVGDGTTDVAAGRDAGALTVAVSWGYRSREQLAPERPDAFVDTPEELRALLLGTREAAP